MNKRFEDKAFDADIHLDWQSRTVKFDKQKKIFSKKTLFPLLASLFIISLILTGLVFLMSYIEIVHFVPKTSPPEYPNPWFIFGFFFGLFLFVSMLNFVSMKFTATSMGMKLRTKRRCYTTLISNPSELIEYDCHDNNEPFVDLEFGNSISEKLISASMVEYESSKTVRKFLVLGAKVPIKRKKLIIKLDGTANGVLKLMEY